MNKNYYNTLKNLAILALLLFPFLLKSQPVKTYNVAEIKLALKKLIAVGNVLYVGAHPDDENTAFLSYCSSEKLLRTGYLSLTRGDGGQNLIGDEQSDLLGIIRTQELLQARKLDGAEQYFSRAVDFGYTKSPEETFRFWNKEKILSDVVWVIRKFRPDIIVTRFPTTGQGGHGQHTASAILALEAFSLAGDSNVFPEQLELADPWSPKQIYWNCWTRAINQMGIETDTLISINLGSYNSLLGKSYTEISAESRSMHKSQGFGDSGWRGNYLNYFILLDGIPSKDDLFSGINITWDRISESSIIQELLKKAYEDFDNENPSAIIPLLLEAYRKINNLPDKNWTQLKSREILNLIRACAGIWIEAIANERIYTPGSEFNVSAGIVNRSNYPLKLEGIHITHQFEDSLMERLLVKGDFVSFDKKIILPEDIELSQPYWLKNDRTSDIFYVADQSMIGMPENPPTLVAHFRLEAEKTKLVFSTPVLYRETDPTHGEVYSPLVIAPPVTINFENNLYLFPSVKEEELRITLKNFSENVFGRLRIKVPENWKAVPPEIDFTFSSKDEEKQFIFNITPPIEESESNISAEVIIGNNIYNRSSVRIDYNHIPRQSVFPIAEAKLVRLNIGNRLVNNIGYIKGSGDKIPEYLRLLGFNVIELNDDHLSNGSLEEFDVIVAGIRAYNTNKRMKVYQKSILDYVNQGGTYIVQYNTLGNLYAEPGPYELNISRDRVTQEDSDVKLINEDHSLFNYPNKITKNDFTGWIQERGLYFPNQWDDNYETFLEMNDNGELPKRGSLLYTKYGNGVFIYTALSFFRELPAGVSGAYRLFVNLISAGKNAKR